MREPVLDAFRHQGEVCRQLGSPFTGRVCDLLVEVLDESTRFGRRILGWPGKPVADALPLRAAGALHALVRSGRAPSLAALYPPHTDADADRLSGEVAHAIREQDGFLYAFLDRPPQTNEVARCSSLLGGCLLAAAATGNPLELLEIGASAGLNLGLDRYRYDLGGRRWGDERSPLLIRSRWDGSHPPLDAPLTIVERAGCDVHPLDPASRDDRERLLAYVWPDQPERLERLAAALSLAEDRHWAVERADAAEWLRTRLEILPTPGRTRLLVHSIVWQYLPAPTREIIDAMMREAGGRTRADAPLAWFTVEADSRSDSAAVHLMLWPGGERRLVGRADFHGRWSDWVV